MMISIAPRFLLILLMVSGVRILFAYSEKTIYNDVIDVIRECNGKTLTLCLKEKALLFVERLPDNFNFGTGLRIKQIADQRQNQTTKNAAKLMPNTIPIPKDDMAREYALDDILWRKLGDYLGSHTFELRFPTETLREFKYTLEEGRKKKGKKDHWWPMMMLLHLKAATIGALMLKVISFVAFKALLLAKIALTIASIVGLKHASGHKHHVSTYEVVPHPHFEHYEDFGHHHDRSLGLSPYNDSPQQFNGNNNIGGV